MKVPSDYRKSTAII